MMREKGWMIGIGVLDIVLVAACIYSISRQDRTAPKITFPEEAVTYSETMDEELLLEGVAAQDAEDGDVSDTLLIEKIAVADGKAIVTYAALDRSNNVAKATRILTVKEEPVKKPTEETAEAGMESEEESDTQTESENAPEEGENPEDGEGGVGQPADGGQDENREAREVPRPAEEEGGQNEGGGQPDPGRANDAPVLTLSTDTLTVPEGAESVDWNACIASLSDDRDSRDALYANLMMDGHVDFTTPGDYPVVLYTKDSDGAGSERVPVTVRIP